MHLSARGSVCFLPSSHSKRKLTDFLLSPFPRALLLPFVGAPPTANGLNPKASDLYTLNERLHDIIENEAHKDKAVGKVRERYC